MSGSFGSYSSMSTTIAPMDITSSLRGRDHSCAYPSWPRRASLSESDNQDPPRATSYLSDDDLLFFSDDACSSEDDSRSVSSSASSASPLHMLGFPPAPARHVPTEAEILEMQRERLAMQRELIREKERRRAAHKQQRRLTGTSSKKTTNKNKLTSMTPIAE